LQSIPILFILSVLLFGMVRIAPGGPLSAAYRNPNVTKEQIELLKKQLGLDQPLPVQYARWMGGILRGDLGESIKFRRPVAVMIAERVPNTLVLVGVSFLVTLIVALPVGILSARKPYSWFDSIATTLTFIGQSVRPGVDPGFLCRHPEPRHRQTAIPGWRHAYDWRRKKPG
jgi:peptide/nickel transport system permease protein